MYPGGRWEKENVYHTSGQSWSTNFSNLPPFPHLKYQNEMYLNSLISSSGGSGESWGEIKNFPGH